MWAKYSAEWEMMPPYIPNLIWGVGSGFWPATVLVLMPWSLGHIISSVPERRGTWAKLHFSGSLLILVLLYWSFSKHQVGSLGIIQGDPHITAKFCLGINQIILLFEDSFLTPTLSQEAGDSGDNGVSIKYVKDESSRIFVVPGSNKFFLLHS